jgi:hypothetical protein
MASSEDPRRFLSAGKHRRDGNQRRGVAQRIAWTPMLFGKRAGRPRAGVKDLRSITDPAAGSEDRLHEDLRPLMLIRFERESYRRSVLTMPAASQSA